MARLKQHYQETIRSHLMKVLGLSNPLQVPRLSKIVLNIGVGEATHDSRRVGAAMEDLSVIAGQKSVVTKARKSLAAFKLRSGMGIGVKVTLRRERMYEFLDRLITIAMPRIRDFRGVSPKSFDGHGNYSLGIREHLVFPEIKYEKAETIFGLDVSIVTTAKKDKEAYFLLESFGIPFSKT